MALEADNPSVWLIEATSEAATAALAAEVAKLVKAGDLITLSGDLGAGKTTFARALIRIISGDPDVEVPSPTFTLMQIYPTPGFPVVHADLYRIRSPDELAELGWDEASNGALVLVEWPDRAGDLLQGDRVDVSFALDPSSDLQSRRITLTGYGSMAQRLAMAHGIAALLERTHFVAAERVHMQGDASTRAYERLVSQDGRAAILMISPQRPDGPPVRSGKPYSAIARLAENIRPFLAVDRGLSALGLSAPKIYASDSRVGLAVLEDLGTEPVVDANGPIDERYAVAVDVLAQLHATHLPDVLPADGGEPYRIPPYDLDALLIEVELLLDWYVPRVTKYALSSGSRAIFLSLWRHILNEISSVRSTWCLRDFHSPNLIWLADRQGPARVGLIDFQDCVLGHPAYDVVSLLQDARVTVGDRLELHLLTYYARLRRQTDANFSTADFARAYATLGAHRASKVLGIFARLDKRDGKPGYLTHLPRIEAYLAKNLSHPVLSELKVWYDTHLPQLATVPAR